MQPLDYGCSDWRQSSQHAANFYRQGRKLWTKEDLRDIEQQLAQSQNRKTFAVRSLHDNIVSIQNPMFDEEFPIWKPYVKYQGYWRLVNCQPEGPRETYLCSYLVDWENTTARKFRGSMVDARLSFEQSRQAWETSKSCTLLRSQLQDLLVSQKVAKIVCLGLGDFCRRPPEWWRRQAAKDVGADAKSTESSSTAKSRLQHSVALTLAQNCRSSSIDNQVQLLTQDPDYTDESIRVLEDNGFSIVGHFGAAGFAEIDDHCLVFSAWPQAPVKQIIADLARPVIIITSDISAFNDSEKPWADADSPRTMAMWEEYDEHKFPTASEEADDLCGIRGLYIHFKKATRLERNGAMN